MTDKKDLTQDTLPSAECPGKIELPTPKERESLDAMRAIKGRVREIKNSLGPLKASGLERDVEKVLGLEREISVLKRDWERWEKRWKAAVKERMIDLGHDDP